MHKPLEHVETAVVSDSRLFVEYTKSQVHEIMHDHNRKWEKCTYKQAVKELIESTKDEQ